MSKCKSHGFLRFLGPTWLYTTPRQRKCWIRWHCSRLSNSESKKKLAFQSNVSNIVTKKNESSQRSDILEGLPSNTRTEQPNMIKWYKSAPIIPWPVQVWLLWPLLDSSRPDLVNIDLNCLSGRNDETWGLIECLRLHSLMYAIAKSREKQVSSSPWVFQNHTIEHLTSTVVWSFIEVKRMSLLVGKWWRVSGGR